MECHDARTTWQDRRRGLLDAATLAAIEAHLADCEACRRDEAADAELSSLLERRVRSRRAPESLHRALEARWSRPRAPAASRGRLVPALLAAALLLSVLAVLAWRARATDDPMVAEAVNDHLRVLYSEHPVEVEPGIHQVKPWFAGRLDFAPVVGFAGDDETPLQGGAVAYFVDRKAAALVYKRRLHVLTLFVFRADGLPWAAAPTEPVGEARGVLRTSRGFHVLLWRKGDLGYALVSDVDAREVLALGAKIAGGAP